MNKKNAYIVSLNGVKNTGGVERVVCYINGLLGKRCDTFIITKSRADYKKLNNLLHPLFISLKLYFKRNKFVIGNSWQCFLYPADLSIHHGTSAGVMKFTGEKKMSIRITALMEKISAKIARKVLAVSENCKDELIKYYGIKEEKITVLNNCVDEQQFFPAEKTHSDKTTILFSGSLSERKGLSKLIQFSEYIEKIGEDIVLKIATNNDNNADCFAGKKKTFVYPDIGFDKMNEFYQSGDILYFPTLYEGFSMSVLEALSAGLPVIGSRFAVTPELQKYDFCKLISNDEDDKTLLDEIKKLHAAFKDKKEDIHKIVADDFGMKQYNEKFEILFKGLGVSE